MDEKIERIKELAKDMGIAFQLAGTTRFGAVAEFLVEVGYRKESDTAREILGLILEKEFEKGDYLTDNELHELFKEKYGVDLGE